jgi:hypothetical protein
MRRSGQRKNSRTRTKSEIGRTKAKSKTRRSPSKELARTAEPHDKRPRPAANGSALRTSAAANGISDLRSANAGLMSFSPLVMLLRQQGLLTSMMLNVMQTQQQWARAFSGLPRRTV